jgi:NitT/TauT family transport system substrate-binding protein
MLLLLLAGCSGLTPQAVPTAEPDQVSLQLNWVHDSGWAAFYAAQANGYYADENLNVEVRVGGFDENGQFIDPISEVASGKATFGVADASNLMPVQASSSLIAVGNVYQRHPLALASMADRDIRRPDDLIGKTVAISPNSAVVFQALLEHEGIDPASVNVIERTDFTINPLVSGEVDVIDAWVINEVPILAAQGYEYNLILPSDYGVIMYPDLIFTTEQMMADQPDVVERFMRATVLGMQAVLDDPESAAKLVLTYDPALNLDEVTEAMYQSLPLIKPAGRQPGIMDAEEIENMQDILLRQSILAEPLDLNRYYAFDLLAELSASR